MKKFYPVLLPAICYFFALLFCYAAISKILDFENFQVQLAQSPLLSAYAGFISYAIIIIELITAVLLCLSPTRLIGLYASLGLMVGFTIYIYLILNYSDFIPCSCGGILEKLGWTEHLIFNLACVALAIVGILLYDRQNKARIMRSVLFSGTITIVSGLIVVAMFVSSEYIIKKDNNFTRRFLLHPILEDTTINLGINSYYFAGISNGNIYLGNIAAPLLLSAVDTALKGVQAVKLHLDNKDYPFRNLQLQVKDSSYYLYDGSVPIIYRGQLNETLARTISYRDAYFTQLAVLDTSNFAIRTQSSQNRQYMLARLSLQRNPKLQPYPSILEKQIDGVFDSDGKLIAAHNSEAMIYTYTYRNRFLVMDKDLNVLRKLHTIDTTTVAKIQTRRLSDGTHKMSAPPLKVNGTLTTNRNLLFNHSMLMGRHESSKAWKQAAVLDLYRTDRQEYAGSFYVNHRKGNTLSQILATDRYLFVLSGNELIRYRFREPITQYFKTGEAENLIE